ncbi:unnamed protein product [Calypogeia fissa]
MSSNRTIIRLGLLLFVMPVPSLAVHSLSYLLYAHRTVLMPGNTFIVSAAASEATTRVDQFVHETVSLPDNTVIVSLAPSGATKGDHKFAHRTDAPPDNTFIMSATSPWDLTNSVLQSSALCRSALPLVVGKKFMDLCTSFTCKNN